MNIIPIEILCMQIFSIRFCHIVILIGDLEVSFLGKNLYSVQTGLQDFIKENDGKMQLAIIPVFDDEDKEAVSENSREQVITEKWKFELSEIKDTLKQNHVKALAWMIATGRLTIKLILPQG